MPIIFWILTGFTLLTVMATIIPLSKSEVWWVRDLDFPRTQIAFIALILLCIALISNDLRNLQSWLLIVPLVLVSIYQLTWIWPYTRFFKKEVKDFEGVGAAETIRILAVNVLMQNEQRDKLLSIIKRKRPDVIVAVETNSKWEAALDELQSELPYALKCPLENLYGMHLYSRFPLEDEKIQFLVEDDVPSIHTLLTLKSGRQISLHCIHPAPPSPTENEESSERDAELVMVGKAVKKEHNTPVIVTGDLNDVAWSETTRLFRKVSGLLDPRIGRGIYSTFHASLPFLRWPLDHLFVSRHFQLITLERLEAFGSDHFPIFAVLALIPDAPSRDNHLTKDGDDEELAEEKIEQQGVSPTSVHTPGEFKYETTRSFSKV